MKLLLSILLVFAFLSPAFAQDKISRAGASVAVNADGSVTVTTATGKTFKIACQATLPVSGAEGQFFCKSGASAGTYLYTGGAWVQLGVSSFTFSSPTTNRLTKFASSTSLADARASDDGTYFHFGELATIGAGTFYSAVDPATDTTSTHLFTLLNGSGKRGLFGQSVWTTSTAPAGSLVGGKFIMETRHTSGTLGFGYGLLTEATANGAGTTSHLAAFNPLGIIANNAVVENYYGIRITGPTKVAGGDVTQKVAQLQIEDPTTAGFSAPSVYSIFSKGTTSINKFEGTVDALHLTGEGSGITALNPSNLSAGMLSSHPVMPLLSNVTLKTGRLRNAGVGNNDLYTVPAGKKALLWRLTTFNSAGSNIVVSSMVKIAGVYTRIQSIVTTTPNQTVSSGLSINGFVFEAGESMAVNTDVAGLNVIALILEFDDTSPVRTVRLFNQGAADFDFYTPPAGKTARVLASFSLPDGGQIVFINNSGSTRAVSIFLAPTAATSPWVTADKMTQTTSSTGSSTQLSAPLWLPAGEKITMTTDGAFSLIYMTVYEFTP